MKVVLIHPPFDDPTLPYHSTAYLAGHLRHNQFKDVFMRDLNAEFINYALDEQTVQAFYSEGEKRIRALWQLQQLDFPRQEQLYFLLTADRIAPGELQQARALLKNKDAFLDFERYARSVKLLSTYFAFLGALSYPSEILCCTHKTRGRYSLFNMTDLLDPTLGGDVCWPFEYYFQEKLVHDAALLFADLIGISIVYDHQMFYALHLARMLKRKWPSKSIVLGGTAITQSYKYMADKNLMKKFFAVCDAIVAGEGETAICEIAASGDLSGERQFTNTITYNRRTDELHFPAVRYENVNELGRPDYSHSWDLYLAPARGINYSPTRGCYWNKCTFCDYGLNSDKPTSPWRERAIPNVIEDLKSVAGQYGVKYVYFAVDVMSPAYLERLSDAMITAGLDIRWAAELRMEKVFTEERCRKLKQAGCTCISFGMESGSQRILDLINKGTKVEFMKQTIKNVSSAGIAAQLMTFSDFPTETPEEKQETLSFIRENAEHWSTGGVGTFLLTGKSIIAKHPERFGLTLIESKDTDICRAIGYKLDNEEDRRIAPTEDCDESFNNTGEIFPLTFGRPWAGGSDTLHSMLYYEVYGRNFFKKASLRGTAPRENHGFDLNDRLQINGKLIECPFDLTQIVRNRGLFRKYRDEVVQSASEPTGRRFAEWCAQLPALQRCGASTQFWLFSGSKMMQLSRGLYELLGRALAQPLKVNAFCALVPDNLRQQILALITTLQREGMLSVLHENETVMVSLRSSLSVNGGKERATQSHTGSVFTKAAGGL